MLWSVLESSNTVMDASVSSEVIVWALSLPGILPEKDVSEA